MSLQIFSIQVISDQKKHKHVQGQACPLKGPAREAFPSPRAGSLITTQKEHILDNNSHEFHIFWGVIIPKTLN